MVGSLDQPLEIRSGTLRYEPALDGLRGLAILLVFLGHAQVSGFILAGWAGVTIFFTLSGYLITSLLVVEREARGRIDLRRFYWRRALRLLPALFVVVGVVVVGGAIGGRPDNLASAAAVIAYSGNWADIAGVQMSQLGHTWSLAIEEQYYLAWPLLLLLVPGRRAAVALCVFGIALAIVLRFVLAPDPTDISRVYLGTDTRADALLLGCLLALTGWRVHRLAGLLGIVLIGVTLQVLRDKYLLTQIGLPVFAGATALIIGGRLPLTFRPLVALGRISYGFYLWHFPVMAITIPAFAELPGSLAVLLWALMTLTLAAASWRYVEVPFLRLKDRLPSARPMSVKPIS